MQSQRSLYGIFGSWELRRDKVFHISWGTLGRYVKYISITKRFLPYLLLIKIIDVWTLNSPCSVSWSKQVRIIASTESSAKTKEQLTSSSTFTNYSGSWMYIFSRTSSSWADAQQRKVVQTVIKWVSGKLCSVICHSNRI